MHTTTTLVYSATHVPFMGWQLQNIVSLSHILSKVVNWKNSVKLTGRSVLWYELEKSEQTLNTHTRSDYYNPCVHAPNVKNKLYLQLHNYQWHTLPCIHITVCFVGGPQKLLSLKLNELLRLTMANIMLHNHEKVWFLLKIIIEWLCTCFLSCSYRRPQWFRLLWVHAITRR